MLRYLDLELSLTVQGDLEWPPTRRGTILRGALGQILRSVACDQFCGGSRKCAFSSQCAYQQLFAPVAQLDSTRLRKNVDRPRPFVLEPGLDEPPVLTAREPLVFAMRLFGRAAALYPYVAVVFSELFRRGLGRARVPCRLDSVRSGANLLFADGRIKAGAPPGFGAMSLDLNLPKTGRTRLALKFITPTYLKDRGREARDGPTAFPALVRRARDRISSLYQFYGPKGTGSDLPWGFREIGEEAEQARCLGDETEWHTQTRRSTRTGRVHALDGLTGSAVYDRVPARSAALVRLAELTHVGKHATFGLGRIQVLS